MIGVDGRKTPFIQPAEALENERLAGKKWPTIGLSQMESVRRTAVADVLNLS
jgi:hypothetical protein